MRLVIATAEPFGAYHLTALSSEMAARKDTEFLHLIPYPTYTQGSSTATPVADLDVLRGADRLVLSGGGFTAWTHSVAAYARSIGLEIRMMELAYGTVDSQPLKPDALAAMSPSGAAVMAKAFEVAASDIPVLGNPQLDHVTPWAPNSTPPRQARRPVLLVSTSELPTRDPDSTLRAIGEQLLGLGLEVYVAPHPREDLSYWSGFTLVRVQDTAHQCQAAIGYPGSVWSYLAAASTPTIGVGAGSTRDGLPPEVLDVANSWINTASEFTLEALASPKPPAAAVAARLCGPLGGSAARVVDFFAN